LDKYIEQLLSDFYCSMVSYGVLLKNIEDSINNTVARKNLAEYLKNGCPQFESKKTQKPILDYSLARKILGKNFIPPEDVMDYDARCFYNSELIEQFHQSFLSLNNRLEWFKANNLTLLASPPKPISAMDIRSSFLDIRPRFDSDHKEIKFPCTDKTSTGWLIIQKEPSQKSFNKTLLEQKELLQSNEYIPNAADISWMIALFKALHKQLLFSRCYIRTSSIGSEKNCFCVGDTIRGGLMVDDYSNNFRYDFVGLVSAIQI